MESKRQKQVGRLIQEKLAQIFLIEGKEFTGGALVTVSQVRMTPDLLVARVYLSIFNTPDPDALMDNIKQNAGAFRRVLGPRVRHLRRVPTLEFFKDDTLDEVFKLEEIFKELNKEKDKDSSED